MKNRRYNKMKNTLLVGAGTGIVAGMFIIGGTNTVLADTTDYYYGKTGYSQSSSVKGMHIMHRWNSATKINSLANNLGLDKDQINKELKSGKSLKQILQENGIVPGQIHKAFETKKNKNKKWRGE